MSSERSNHVFFTADEHYGHWNIVKHMKRPFSTIEEHDIFLINSHNEVVDKGDLVIHVGDFTLFGRDFAQAIINRLNGSHVFIAGTHDQWIRKGERKHLWTRTIDNTYVVACHYAMRTWPRSHYGAIQVFGHSHGTLPPIGRQYDVGVDCNDFRPISLANILRCLLYTEIHIPDYHVENR